VRLSLILPFVFAGSLASQTYQDLLNQGVQAFKAARYAEAVAYFQRAVEASPTEATARLYLGTAYMQQYIPGAESDDNLVLARNAEAEFQKVLDLDPGHKVALASSASLALNMKKWDQARDRYKQLIAVDPQNKEAYYSLGFIAWCRWYPSYGKARVGLGMKQEDPGPLIDPATRASLRSQWTATLDEGVDSLKRALALDPEYDDAMAYMNLFIRERADLLETREEYVKAVADADEWVRKALETKRLKAQRRQNLTR
jgi:tetratricopeptide (TPR) repeat protein